MEPWVAAAVILVCGFGIWQGMQAVWSVCAHVASLRRKGMAVNPAEVFCGLTDPVAKHLRRGIASFAAYGALIGGILLQTGSGLQGPLFLAMLAGGGSFTLCLVVSRQILIHRRKTFTRQLEDALRLMVGSLSSGLSIKQGFCLVVEKGSWPISDEFHRVLSDMRVGRSCPEALECLADRMGIEEARTFSFAVSTAQRWGGDLSLVLERLATVLRDRTVFEERRTALTAQGMLEAYALSGMPVVILGMLWMLDRGVVFQFLASPIGPILLGVASMLVLTGFLIIRRIVVFDP